LPRCHATGTEGWSARDGSCRLSPEADATRCLMVTRLLIWDAGLFDPLIQERKRKGIDRYDEVWEGMYVLPSMPNNAHQLLVDDLDDILREVTKKSGLGQSYPGANVSDRRKGWEYNYRVPDMVVVLRNSR